jgi:hypothetical protein
VFNKIAWEEPSLVVPMVPTPSSTNATFQICTTVTASPSFKSGAEMLPIPSITAPPGKVPVKPVPKEPTPSITTCAKKRLPLPWPTEAELEKDASRSPSKSLAPPVDDAVVDTVPDTGTVAPNVTDTVSTTIHEIEIGICDSLVVAEIP